MSRALRFLAVAAVGCGFAVSAVVSAGSAAADGGLWIPPSWVSVSVGTMSQAQAGLTGRAPGFTRDAGVTGGVLVSDGMYSGPGNIGGACLYIRCITGKVGGVNADGSPRFAMHVVADNSGHDGSGYYEGAPIGGNMGQPRFWCANADGSQNDGGGAYDGTSWPAMCSYGVFSFYLGYGNDLGYSWDSWTYTVADAHSAIWTTTVGCLAGSVRYVTEVSEPGGAAPAAFCLGVEYPVSVRVVDGVTSQTVLDAVVANRADWLRYINEGGASGPILRADGACVVNAGRLWFTLARSDCGAGEPTKSPDPSTVGGGSDNPVVSAIQELGSNIYQTFQDVFTCDTGRCDLTGLEASMTGIQTKLTPSAWTSEVQSFPSYFNATCGCSGFHFSWRWGVPGQVADMEGDIGNSCAGSPLATAAEFSRAVSRVIIVVGGLGACLRLIGASLSYVGLVSDTFGSGSGPEASRPRSDSSDKIELR